MGVLYRRRYLYTFFLFLSLKVAEGCYRAVLENSLTKAVKKHKKRGKKKIVLFKDPGRQMQGGGGEKRGGKEKNSAMICCCSGGWGWRRGFGVLSYNHNLYLIFLLYKKNSIRHLSINRLLSSLVDSLRSIGRRWSGLNNWCLDGSVHRLLV
jgi:hypothetical protein